MIRVRIENKNQSVSSIRISDHAGSAPYGEDLVCAGMSGIVVGAFNAIDEMFPEACDLSIQPGEKVNVSLKVIHDSHDLQTALKMFVLQMETLRDSYSPYLQIKKNQL